MPILFTYKGALNLAQNEFRAATSKGEYPYPPALNDFVSDGQINRGQDLGYTHIPLEFVVGTRAGGRTYAFARNFMPLMKVSTEFAAKWTALCQSQMREGIREPILAYEYLNRYYVQEGNKRVSVLKYCEAETVYAHVIRVLPEPGEFDKQKEELYSELTSFIRYSGVNYFELSKPGYARLQQLVGKRPEERWTDDDRREFSSVHYHFRKVYEAMGGSDLTSTRGDALLALIEVYGYPALRYANEDQIKRMLSKAWDDIALLQKNIAIDLKLDPDDEKKPGLLTQVLSIGEKKVKKAAFIHEDNCEISPWTQVHEFAREYAQRILGDYVQTTSYFNAMDAGPLKVLEQAVADGSTVIFTTSPVLQPASLRCAVEHPNVTILNCTQISPHRYIRTYHVRHYEAEFVLGSIAGALARDGRIGYIGYWSGNVEGDQMNRVHTASDIAGVNAFALGAQMVNPWAKVFLEWYNGKDLPDVSGRLREKGLRLISFPDYLPHVDGSFGLCQFTGESAVTLAYLVMNWGVYYETLLRRILDRSLKSEYEKSDRAVNYYWGMSAGVVGVECTDTLPACTRNLAELLQDNIRRGLSHPFKGYIQAHTDRKIDGELTMDLIMGMDWLADNVEGAFPGSMEAKSK